MKQKIKKQEKRLKNAIRLDGMILEVEKTLKENKDKLASS